MAVRNLPLMNNNGLSKFIKLGDGEVTSDYYGPDTGEESWMCNCGCYAFYLTKAGTYCWDCHKEHTFE